MTNKKKNDTAASAGAGSESNNIEYRSTHARGTDKKKNPLVLNRYQPDLRQKRVQKRIVDALEYVLPHYLSGRELQLSNKVLERHFGSHTKPMFKWLRSRILSEVRSYSVVAARAITYKVKQDGFDRLWLQMHGRTFDYAIERARQLEPTFRQYIEAEGDGAVPLPLHSTVEGGRLYGPHQTLEKSVRAVLLKGCYDYDIQSAMPTLVLQSVSNDWRAEFPLWAKYLGYRTHYREKLAKDYKITVAQAKEVFQGMFDLRNFNAGRSGISAVIGMEKCKRAMEDTLLVGLREEAKRAWKLAGLAKASDGSARFAYYEQIEQKVMRAIYEIASANGVRYWPFHDGFTVLERGKKISDLERFHRILKEMTGFNIRLDEKIL